MTITLLTRNFKSEKSELNFEPSVFGLPTSSLLIPITRLSKNEKNELNFESPVFGLPTSSTYNNNYQIYIKENYEKSALNFESPVFGLPTSSS